MKNENESKEKIRKSGSSTSEVVESVDLTVRPTTSRELNKCKPSAPIANANNNNDESNVLQISTPSEQQCVGIRNVNNHLPNSQPNLRGPRIDIPRMASSNGAIGLKKAASKKSTVAIPPSYSAVLRLGPPITQIDSMTYPSIPFIVRQPPPSYAQVQQGAWDENPSVISADSLSLGPNPLYVACPRCRTIVVSDVQTERSHLSYILSVVLCVFMCWPCCLLPFCLKSCRNTYHFCPTCHYYLGAYRPC